MLKMKTRVRMMTHFSRQFEFARGSLEEQLLKSSKSPYSQFISPDISKLSNNPRELTNPLHYSKWEITMNITTAVNSFAPKHVLVFCTCTIALLTFLRQSKPNNSGYNAMYESYLQSLVLQSNRSQQGWKCKTVPFQKGGAQTKLWYVKMLNSGWCT